MASDRQKYVRITTDLTQSEYRRLVEKTRSIGATHSGFVRKLISRATKDVEIPTDDSQRENQ